MKSKSARLNETVAFIRNCLALDAGQRSRAADQVDVYIASLGNAKNALSTSLSINQSGADPAQHRHYRRAYALLHKLLAAELGAFVLAGLPAGDVSVTGVNAVTHLPRLVKMAAILRCQKTFSNYMMLQAMNELLNTPLLFLQQNPVMVSGSPLLGQGPGDMNQMPFYLSYNFTQERYDLTPAPMPGCAPVMADSVGARWWTDIPGSYDLANPNNANFSQLEGTELGSQLMVTTQFTGCAFAMKNFNGHTYCAHTTPTRAPGFAHAVRILTGNQLAQEIHSLNGVAGDFQNAAGGPGLAVYGAGWSHGTIGGTFYPNGLGGGGNYMTIIGTPAGGGFFQIYSQITQNRAITSAQRIF